MKTKPTLPASTICRTTCRPSRSTRRPIADSRRGFANGSRNCVSTMPRSATRTLANDAADPLLDLPNLTHSTTPLGTNSLDNAEVRRDGKPRSFDFPVKDHVDLGEALGLMDFPVAVKLAGTRFSFLRGEFARLHRALAQFMLDVHTREHGYTECYTPYIANTDTLIGTTQLPKFAADMFSVRKGGSEGEN